MNKLFLFLIAALLGVTAADAATPLPKYLRDLDRPYNAGDWTLQCNSSRYCQIIGVAKIPKDFVGVRAVVLIGRGIAKDAKPRLRLVFIDAMGAMAVPQPEDGWRLYARGLPKMPPPLRLGLNAADPQGAYPVAQEAAAKIISALRRWPESRISNRGKLAVRMPQGDLDRLFRKMDRLQHPPQPRLTAAEEAEWLKEYHYTILRASPIDAPVPDSVLLSCDTRTYVNQPFGVHLGEKHQLWTAECPEGTKVFLQEGSKEPTKFDVRDAEGRIHPHGYAAINIDSSMLEVQLPRKGNEGCGRQLKFGFTGQGFAMIEDRRYNRCRAVPHEFWPLVWHPTSWKYADPPPSNGGNDAPAIEGVKTP